MGPIKAIWKRLGKAYRRAEAVYVSVIRYIDGPYGESLRRRYYSRRLKSMGEGVRIDTGVFIYGCRHVSIGEGTHIDKNCIIVGSPSNIDLSSRVLRTRRVEFDGLSPGEVNIGKFCHIAQNCMIFGYGGVRIGDFCAMSTGAKIYSLISMEYNPDDPAEIVSIMPLEGISPTMVGKVVMEDNSWLGIDVVVIPGVKIGKNSFVRSRSIVMSSFGDNSYIAGDPAEYLRKRFKEKRS